MCIRDSAIRDHLHFFADFIKAPAHEALDGKHRVFWIRNGLPLGDLPHQPLTVLGKRDNGGRQTTALGIGNDDRLSAFHHGDHRVGGAQVDPDDLAHSSHSYARLARNLSPLHYKKMSLILSIVPSRHGPSTSHAGAG